MRKRFLAAKVNINGSIYSGHLQTLINLIPEAIKSNPSIKLGKSSWKWSFAEIKEVSEEKYVFGYFVKSKKEKKKLLNGSIIETYELPKPAAYSSFFMYQYDQEILIFEETSDVRREDFIFFFEKIIFSSKFEIGEISVQLIPLKDIIYKEIAQMEYLTKIEFDLVQSNPISNDTYRDLDDIIQKEKATKFKAVFENPNGLNKDGKLIKSGIEKAQNGYGTVSATGFSRVDSRGRRKTRRVTQRFQSKNSIYMTHTDRDLPQNELISKLREFADKIASLFF